MPADDKENARLIVSQIVVDAVEDFGMSYPEMTTERTQQLAEIWAGLVS